MSGRTEKVVPLQGEAWDAKVDVDGLVRLPDGQHLCKYLGHETVFLFKSGKAILNFEVTQGEPHAGTRLIKPYRVRLNGRPSKGGRFELGRSSELLRDIVRLNDMKIRPDRISLQFLARSLWVVQTRTVERDYQQRPIPEPLRYSVIDTIVERG